MKNLTMLTWITQLGLSVAVSPAIFILLAVWLRDSCGWGGWVLWLGIALGVYSAVTGFVFGLKTMTRICRKENQTPPVAFNDHD